MFIWDFWGFLGGGTSFPPPFESARVDYIAVEDHQNTMTLNTIPPTVHASK